MPPRATIGVDPSIVDEIDDWPAAGRRDADARSPSEPTSEHVRQDEAGAPDSSGRTADDDVAAADERRRPRLFEDARRRCRAARPSPRRPARSRRRAPRSESVATSSDRSASVRYHVDRLLDDAAVAHAQQPVGAGRDRRIVRDDDHRRAVGVQTIEQRDDLLARAPDRARRSARRRAAGAAGSRAHVRWPRAASLRPRARPDDGPARAARPTYSSSSRVRSRRSARPTPASACGSSTFSHAVSMGSRKNRWNTKPICAAAACCARRPTATRSRGPGRST